ncbi:transmembrane protein 165 [Indicator indicator]|uniref:transmembrane protein 165 n=1 Tax=Indicator indicator TaxID=1002788 RepID=UPI0023DF92D6|nr:transmembrane protein 165 [Indicator indicator]
MGSPLPRAAAMLLAAALLLLAAPAGLRAAPEEEAGRKKEPPPPPAAAQGAEQRAEVRRGGDGPHRLPAQPSLPLCLLQAGRGGGSGAVAPRGSSHPAGRKGSSQVAPVPVANEEPADKTNLGFIHAFVAAISVIIVSELGDKTFFIAAIMAMRYNRLTVLAGAMLALGLMTCLSVLFGYATTVIPRVYTYYVSTALFAVFGIRMLREGLKMSPDEGQEELEEVQAEIKKKDEELQRTKLSNGPGDVESGPGTTIPQKKWLHFISPIFVQAFTLTFLAEWGDRSQLTTIVLAARENSSCAKAQT